MFEDVGEKIKVSAIIVFIVFMVGALAGAIVVWVQEWMDARAIVGLGVLAGGAAVSFFFALLVRGFGIIVSHYERAENEYKYRTTPHSSNSYNGSLFKNMNNNLAPKGSVVSGEWKCPKCGRVNQNYVGTCGCGEIKPK